MHATSARAFVRFVALSCRGDAPPKQTNEISNRVLAESAIVYPDPFEHREAIGDRHEVENERTHVGAIDLANLALLLPRRHQFQSQLLEWRVGVPLPEGVEAEGRVGRERCQ